MPGAPRSISTERADVDVAVGLGGEERVIEGEHSACGAGSRNLSLCIDRSDVDAAVGAAKTEIGDGVGLCCNRHCGEGREQCGDCNLQVSDFHGNSRARCGEERDMRYRFQL
jgi:hypothetical protein